MENPIIEIAGSPDLPLPPAAIAALEAGKVLYFPDVSFQPAPAELQLFTPTIRAPKSRNISLDATGRLHGAAVAPGQQAELAAMLERFRTRAETLLATLCPRYQPALRRGPVSFRPDAVETRMQSWRADDRRLHVDAFPSRPCRGERILRVFSNVNPSGAARLWRLGEPLEQAARRFLPQFSPYARWQAQLLLRLGITKSLRSEYDHLMLQLHDAMKRSRDYQQNAPQISFGFPSGSTWVCFSDQTSHAAMSGQYLLELTAHLPPTAQYDASASPLAILTRLTGRTLV